MFNLARQGEEKQARDLVLTSLEAQQSHPGERRIAAAGRKQ